MSTVSIRAALEAAVATMTTIQLVYENESDPLPDTDVAYVAVQVAFATPLYNEIGSGHWQEVGDLNLHGQFPLDGGWGAAQAFADAVRAAFPPKTTLVTTDGLKIIIPRPASIPTAMRDGDRWSQPITVPFFVQI